MDRLKGKDNPRFKHGFSQNHKTYVAWCKIKNRCLNKNCKDYPSYGGSNVTINPLFENDFLAFYNEIGEAPKDGQRWSVDRIDYTKNYEPGNIRWASDKQQARNRSKPKTNSSGVNGVGWDLKVSRNKTKTSLYAFAHWCEYQGDTGTLKKKCFSVKKLGLLESFAAACAHREAKIKELNQLGYNYSENHGKQ